MRLRSFCHRHTGFESGVPFCFRLRLFRAAHVSCTCIFSRVNRCTCAAHVCATIPRAQLHLLCTYRMHVCPHVPHVRIIPAQRRAEFPRSSIRTLPQLHTCPPKWRVNLAGCVAPSTKCRTENIIFPRHRATHLNPVFRSIAPQNNNPKNVPVHGLNVIASARIQTSSNGGFATRRKGRCAPLARWPAGQP